MAAALGYSATGTAAAGSSSVGTIGTGSDAVDIEVEDINPSGSRPIELGATVDAGSNDINNVAALETADLHSDSRTADYVVYKDGSQSRAIGRGTLSDVTSGTDASVVQTAIENLPDNGANDEHVGLLQFKRGTWNFGATDITVYRGTRLRGLGWDHKHSTGSFSGPFTRFKWTGGSDGIHPPNVDSDKVNSIVISKIAFEGPGKNTTGAKAMTDVGYSNHPDLFEVRDCLFRDFQHNIDFSNDPDSIWIDKNHFYNAGGYSVSIDTAEAFISRNFSWHLIDGDHYKATPGIFVQNQLNGGGATGINGAGGAIVVGNLFGSIKFNDQSVFDAKLVAWNRFRGDDTQHVSCESDGQKVGPNEWAGSPSNANVRFRADNCKSYDGTATFDDNGSANVINGEARESANANEPQASYPHGTLVRFTDTGDGSGTGTYLIPRSGPPVKLSSNAL
jgi:hypothetical protein